jgi:hypothetical protein
MNNAICARPQTFKSSVFDIGLIFLLRYLYMEAPKEDKKMNNFPNPYGQQTAAYNYQQIQQMFPQPQGSVYSINTPTEIGNVPIGSTGLSVAICFNEQLMYIKSF